MTLDYNGAAASGRPNRWPFWLASAKPARTGGCPPVFWGRAFVAENCAKATNNSPAKDERLQCAIKTRLPEKFRVGSEM